MQPACNLPGPVAVRGAFQSVCPARDPVGLFLTFYKLFQKTFQLLRFFFRKFGQNEALQAL